jgi:anthranilate phosphoribosyltransferase
MKELLKKLTNHYILTKEEAKAVMLKVGQGEFNSSQIAVLISVYMMRNIRVEELLGFREALLEMCLDANLSEYNPIDIVGTGGDGKDTFNISTLSCFVVAGAGIKVAKHGNYAVSSNCGSSNVIEKLGYTFTNKKDLLRKQLEESNFCMLHAPLFHPALKNVAPVRKELGLKTIFNMLGPLVNPAIPTYHLLGTYNLDLARLYAYIHQSLESKFSVVHALDGYDEISLTGSFKMISNQIDRVLEPSDLGLNQHKSIELTGGKTIDDAANIFLSILENKATKAQKEVVLANAGIAISVAMPDISLLDAIATARESLESGKALESLKKAIQLTSKY